MEVDGKADLKCFPFGNLAEQVRNIQWEIKMTNRRTLTEQVNKFDSNSVGRAIPLTFLIRVGYMNILQ